MRYIGGKGKIAKPITEAILSNSTSRKFYLEPFIGGLAVFPRMVPHFEWAVGGDLHPDLVALWNALIFDGWQPPETYSEDEYASLKDAPPSPDRALAGFGGSFGGKWFGGYARGGNNSDGTPRDHQNESVRSALRSRDMIHASTVPSRLGRFRNQSYDEWTPVAGTVVYCDPPYATTQGYSTGDFDSLAFWGKCESWASMGVEVFISEYTAPSTATEVWSHKHRQSLTTPEQGRSETIEKLFKIGAT